MKLSIIPFFLVATATAKLGEGDNERRGLLPFGLNFCAPCTYGIPNGTPSLFGFALLCQHDTDDSCYVPPLPPQQPIPYPTDDGCYAGTTLCLTFPAPVPPTCLENFDDCTNTGDCCDDLECVPQSEWWSRCEPVQ